MGNNYQFHSIGQFDDATISVTSEGGAKERLVDYKYNSVWSSVGSDDLTQEVLEFDLGAGVSASLRYLLLINGNSASGSAEYWNGSAWVAFGSPWSGNTESNLIIDYGSNLTGIQKIRVNLDTTFPTETEKFQGMVIATQLFFELEKNPVESSISSIPASTQSQNKRGAINVSRFDDSIRQFVFVLADLNAENDIENLEDLWESMVSFILIPFGDSEFETIGYRKKDIRRYVVEGIIKNKLNSVIVEAGTSTTIVCKESLK